MLNIQIYLIPTQSRSEGVANEATVMGGKLARRQISKFNKHFLIYEMF